MCSCWMLLPNMAKETIYLCNFRVSVDGDWLCLEELNDIELDVTSQNANDNEGWYKKAIYKTIILFV